MIIKGESINIQNILLDEEKADMINVFSFTQTGLQIYTSRDHHHSHPKLPVFHSPKLSILYVTDCFP